MGKSGRRKRDHMADLFAIMDRNYSRNRLVMSGEIIVSGKDFRSIYKLLGNVDRKIKRLEER